MLCKCVKSRVYPLCMSPALNGSFALECFKRGNAIKVCNRIMFDFYLGLPHIHIYIYICIYTGVYIDIDPAWNVCICVWYTE